MARRLQFAFQYVASPKEKKTSIVNITSITTEDNKEYVLPQEMRFISDQEELANTDVYKRVKKSFTQRGQNRTVWITLTEEMEQTYFDEEETMAPRRKQRTKFVWDEERSNFLLHCHELISAKQLAKKQFQVQLRRMFREKYPECELADSTLYTYALTVKKEKPLPDNSRVSFWDQATDEFLIECVLRAQNRYFGLPKIGESPRQEAKVKSILRLDVD
ncbi:hypothetical protein CBL_07160 [Carabus blaptoides fortunei]